ncbi:MAG: serine hydrolase [Xanthomonadaceae bacterium]|nr:serine hydrolase [Xanthomonadaceae bacterium]
MAVKSSYLSFFDQLESLTRDQLTRVLKQRTLDRAFIDQRTNACAELNKLLHVDILDTYYETVIGHEDGNGRIVIGPRSAEYTKPMGKPIADLPEHLKGYHITTFSPPSNEKVCTTALSVLGISLRDEPELVSELIDKSQERIKWGADFEDSLVPTKETLAIAQGNLNKCYSQKIHRAALPIKRLPGIALSHHLDEFAKHVFEHWRNPEALTFYIPKLENEEEAAYIHSVVSSAEKLLKEEHSEYKLGSIRLIIVFENPRLIYRANEVIDALYPYFAGASLGWHDYLAATARIFKEDPNYRIPAKSDPNIVISHIKSSHELIAHVVGGRGGLAIGGMFGVIPESTELYSPEFQVVMKGFIRDVITQLRRGLIGFWVAHPALIRYGVALVEVWKQKDPNKLEELVIELLKKEHQADILEFLRAPDVASLSATEPLYPRSRSANNDPKEIRYNVRQSLAYLTEWLTGNANAALPAQLGGKSVQVLDDLATVERSRWQVWHEIHHGRFELSEFLRIVHQEMRFIHKPTQAMNILIKLMTDEFPVESATQLLIPALRANHEVTLAPHIQRFNEYFSSCGSMRFAKSLSSNISLDITQASMIVMSFSQEEIIEAASFHGDIGENKKNLDLTATQEQALVLKEGDDKRAELKKLGVKYFKKYGFKYLISAQGKTSEQIKANLDQRLNGDKKTELENARKALWEIAQKRLASIAEKDLKGKIEQALKKYEVTGAQISVSSAKNAIQTLSFGSTTTDTWFELASLSKTIATVFSLEYFKKHNISLTSSVNALFEGTESPYRIPSGDAVTLTHLLNHSALNMHYVNGVPRAKEMPEISKWLKNIKVANEPGSSFQYSGGGFLVLEHLIESLEKKSIRELTHEFFQTLGIQNISFDQTKLAEHTETRDYKMFPAFAAGAIGQASSMTLLLEKLTVAYHDPLATGPISHETAVLMLQDTNTSSQSFMGVNIGLGVFIAEAGRNRLAIHQGANDGYRCLFVYCYRGPNQGLSFTILCQGDNNGMLFVARTAQLILTELRMSGIDTYQFKSDFNSSNFKQEEIVNLGYKNLVFSAFKPDLPEAITRDYLEDPLSRYNHAIGAKIIEVSNQRFARAENLISPYEPVFDPELYGAQGKIMDSWESVRHNPKPTDWMILELKKPSAISTVSFSTKFHNGNHPSHAMIDGLVPKTALDGHAIKFVKTTDSKTVFKQIKVSMFPDGGLTRLGLYGDDFPAELIKSFSYPNPIPHSKKPLAPKYTPTPEMIEENWKRHPKNTPVDVACSAYGGTIVRASNEHYGPASQVISPYPPLDMFDGFESARSRTPGHFEELEIKLARKCKINMIEIDYKFYVNNNPRELKISAKIHDEWKEIVPQTYVKPFAANKIQLRINESQEIEFLKFTVIPDGGMNRLRVYSTSLN